MVSYVLIYFISSSLHVLAELSKVSEVSAMLKVSTIPFYYYDQIPGNQQCPAYFYPVVMPTAAAPPAASGSIPAEAGAEDPALSPSPHAHGQEDLQGHRRILSSGG